MDQLKNALNNKNINNCRSIIIASIRQEISTKAEFNKNLRKCLNTFGNNFFDVDDGLTISNNKKDLFASIKVNFSQKKINQLLALLPDTQVAANAIPKKKLSKKYMAIAGLIILIVFISVIYLSLSDSGTTGKTTQTQEKSQD